MKSNIKRTGRYGTRARRVRRHSEEEISPHRKNLLSNASCHPLTDTSTKMVKPATMLMRDRSTRSESIHLLSLLAPSSSWPFRLSAIRCGVQHHTAPASIGQTNTRGALNLSKAQALHHSGTTPHVPGAKRPGLGSYKNQATNQARDDGHVNRGVLDYSSRATTGLLSDLYICNEQFRSAGGTSTRSGAGVVLAPSATIEALKGWTTRRCIHRHTQPTLAC